MPDDVERDYEQEGRTGLLKRFRYLAKKRAHFWNRWYREYFIDLREQDTWKTGNGKRNMEVGEIVSVHSKNEKRGMWKMGRIEEKIEGRDGIVRGAGVKLITKEKPVYINKTVQKLYSLEMQSKADVEKENISDTVKRVGLDNAQIRRANKRAAALDAAWKTKLILGQ